MKRTGKALLLALCAILLVVITAAGTVAYLSASDAVKNTFTVGKVKIDLDEAKVDNNGVPVEGASRVKENSYKLIPGCTYTKDPTVTVLHGSVDSYVRMKVTLNNAAAIIAMCTDPEYADSGTTGVEDAYPLIRMVKFTEDAYKWDGLVPDNMFDTEEMLKSSKYFVKGDDTLTYYFYYNGTVAAPDKDVVLPVLFNQISVPDWTTGTQLDALNDFCISITAEAIQADGFADADAAWVAFAAQK